LIKFLTTDTDALTTLADAIGNVPTTKAALASPSLGLSKDPHFAPFLQVFKNPLTTTTPASADGGSYLTNFGHFVEKWQSGSVTDLKAGLDAVDKQNNAALKLGQ
jgi:multiple sugar transport system substrate-binding protein